MVNPRSTLMHISRSVMAQVLDALTEDSDLRLKSLKVGGGMAVNDLFLQIQADLLGIPVSTHATLSPHLPFPRFSLLRSARGPTVETTALGAAVAAGLAVGVYSRELLAEIHAQAETSFDPRLDEATRQQKTKGWAKAVAKSFGWVDE